jgi:hypothetical protein
MVGISDLHWDISLSELASEMVQKQFAMILLDVGWI